MFTKSFLICKDDILGKICEFYVIFVRCFISELTAIILSDYILTDLGMDVYGHNGS